MYSETEFDKLERGRWTSCRRIKSWITDSKLNFHEDLIPWLRIWIKFGLSIISYSRLFWYQVSFKIRCKWSFSKTLRWNTELLLKQCSVIINLKYNSSSSCTLVDIVHPVPMLILFILYPCWYSWEFPLNGFQSRT